MDLPLILKGTRNYLQWRLPTLEHLTLLKFSCILSYICGLSQPFLASLWACFFDLIAQFSTLTSSTVRPKYRLLHLLNINLLQLGTKQILGTPTEVGHNGQRIKVSLSTAKCGKCTYFILFQKLKMATQLETQQSKRCLCALTGGTSRGWEKHNILQKTVTVDTAVSYMSYNLT